MILVAPRTGSDGTTAGALAAVVDGVVVGLVVAAVAATTPLSSVEARGNGGDAGHRLSPLVVAEEWRKAPPESVRVHLVT